ncbi:unnamed protein product [Ambrosiozyma monospora]|uniref:Unnamed protein product n=1 Tax=Ambrosiozyma monospora TaxID=43982 RepID=A0ACB5TH07_AMBMO|nr:unnamed protein product [Ambrosiozyma monospora]
MWPTIIRYASSLIFETAFFANLYSSGLFIELARLKRLTFTVETVSDIHLMKKILQALANRRIKKNDLSLVLRYDLMKDSSDLNDHLDDLIQLSNNVNGGDCFDGKLNLSTTIEISFTWMPSSRLVIKKFQDLLLAGKVTSIDIEFSNGADENDFKIFETLNQMPFLGTLFILGSGARDTATSTVIISNPNITNLQHHLVPLELRFSFPDLPSKLQWLTLSSSSPLSFESIPDTLSDLTLYDF